VDASDESPVFAGIKRQYMGKITQTGKKAHNNEPDGAAPHHGCETNQYFL
jgi:hypothetical protein